MAQEPDPGPAIASPHLEAGGSVDSHAALEECCPDQVRLVRARSGLGPALLGRVPTAGKGSSGNRAAGWVARGVVGGAARITSKSGWITGQAGPSLERRAEMQIAA